MTTTPHASLTGANLHENKGVSGASDNTVATASSGATVWQKVNKNMMDSTSVKNTNTLSVQTHIMDISAASSGWVAVPLACKVIKIYITVDGAVDADTVVTAKIGGASVTGGATTLTASGSAAGSSFNATPSAANTLTAGQAIEFAGDGGASTARIATITAVLDVS